MKSYVTVLRPLPTIILHVFFVLEGVTAEDFVQRDQDEIDAGFTDAEAQLFAQTLAALLGTESQNVEVMAVLDVPGK